MKDEEKWFTSVGVSREAYKILERLKHGKKLVFVSRAILSYAEREGKAFLEKNRIE